VFINLLTNAAKYTPEGGKIQVTLAEEIPERAAEARGDRWATVRVRDTGAGIAPEMLERVFELFAQVNPHEARTHSGLGIGLSLVRGLVGLHGGTVWAASDGPGRGSEFTVRLPLLKTVGEPRHLLAGMNRLAAVPSLRLLIVDDNVDTANGLALHLRETGKHVVLLAHTGSDGLAAAKEFAPELVLLDIGLPDIDGYEVARRLRADQRFDEVPLIALTGFCGQSDRVRAESAGFDAYLVKPVPYEMLAEVLAAKAPAVRGHA
jgi:CheY-like chemotaxis protein